MAAVTAKMVKELRETTGAGMMECKKALSESDGDMDKAVEYLQEHGQAKALKKANRIAAEGRVAVVEEGNTAAIVEVNCETDFASAGDEFKAYVDSVAEQAIKSDAADIDAFLAEPWHEDTSKTVKDANTDKIARIGENLSIRRFKKVSVDNGCIVSYIHGNGRIGVLVAAETSNTNDDVKEALKNIAMQIAALNPKYISDADVDQSYIDEQKGILKAQIDNDPKESAKPDKVKEGMIMGRLKKELKEVCLLDQVYVKAEDGKQSVAKYLEQVSKANDTQITIKEFVRFETGEGIEKKEENFAEEVAKQMQ